MRDAARAIPEITGNLFGRRRPIRARCATPSRATVAARGGLVSLEHVATSVVCTLCKLAEALEMIPAELFPGAK